MFWKMCHSQHLILTQSDTETSIQPYPLMVSLPLYMFIGKWVENFVCSFSQVSHRINKPDKDVIKCCVNFAIVKKISAFFPHIG